MTPGADLTVPGTDAPHSAATGTEAAQGTPAPFPVDPAVAAAVARRRRGSVRRLVVVGAVLVAAFGYLLAKGLGNSLDYFDTVDQAIHERATLGTQTLRVEGTVLPGVSQSHGDVVFTIEANGVKALVVNQGSPPQLFQPNIPVVVVGHFAAGSDTFLSDQIMVKHSASYVAANPGHIAQANRQAAAIKAKESAGTAAGTKPAGAGTPSTSP